MSQYDAVLSYDSDCPYCSVAAVALRRLRSIGAVSWDDDAAQAFLDDQFGETPFVMVLVDERRRRVSAGRSAAEELAERAGTPGIVGSLVRDRYDDIARVVGLASGRGRNPDDYHDIYPLAVESRLLFEALVDRAGDETLSTA